MVTPKKAAPVSGAADLLSEILSRSLEVMRDLSAAASTASEEASVAGARHLVKFQRSTLKVGLELVSKAQKYSEKTLHGAVKEGKWLPREGKEVVEDWSNMMKSGVEELTRVTDKSFEMLLNYLDRVEKEKRAGASKKALRTPRPAGSASAPVKKTPAKRKPAAKKRSRPGQA